MLDDAEWAQLTPMLIDMTTGLKRCGERGNTPVSEAMKRSYEVEALVKYFELTAFRETNVQALWHRAALQLHR